MWNCTEDKMTVTIQLIRHGKTKGNLEKRFAGTREDGAPIQPNDAQEIMDLLKDLWATGDTQKVADGVLGATSIWSEDLNKVEGLNAMVKQYLDLIQSKGMLEAVKTII